MDIQQITNQLNPEQQKAVLSTEGPVLILAGAGSGKTRVLVHRIAWLLDGIGVSPAQILAITFTNKAADEMRRRVDDMIGFGSEQIHVSTFHSLCVRILRREAELLGYTRYFSIYDTDDQKTLMKNLMKEKNIDTSRFNAKGILNRISSAKNELITPELRTYLYDFIKDPGDVRGLFVPRKNFTMGKNLPSSYPDYQLRFLAREGTEWPEKIHSTPIVNGKVGYIDKKHKELAMVHLDDSTKATLRRLDTYTDNEMARRLGKRVTYASIVFAPTFRFFKFFVLKGGFRYGVAGFVQAARQAIYKFTTLCKVYEAQHNVGK